MMGQALYLAHQIGQDAEQRRLRIAQRSTQRREGLVTRLARTLANRRTEAPK